MSEHTNNEVYINFGKKLKTFRIENNLTQEQLSEKLGISLKYISRIENGNNGIKTQTLINCINILGFTPNTLYSDFITNENILVDIEISNKISKLTKSKKEFINSFIDLLDDV